MNSTSKTTGLLLEIILSVVFFAFISTAVLQIFMYAQELERDSRDKSAAMMLAQSIGDMYRSHVTLSSYEPYQAALAEETHNRSVIRLNDSLAPLPAEAADKETFDCFVIIDSEAVSSSEAGVLNRASIQVEKHGKVLFELIVDVYKPEASI